MKNEFLKLGEASILITEVTENVDELLKLFQLSDSEEIEFNNIVSDKRKLEYLGVRIALKELLNKKPEINYDENGKPHLADESFHISISHTKNYIAVMIHPSRRVGIDIEFRNDKIQKIYKRFLSETEQLHLSNINDIRPLHIAWSVKEALYKIIGKEAVDFAKQLEILPFELQNSGQLAAKHVLSEKKFELYYKITTDYTLAYCVE